MRGGDCLYGTTGEGGCGCVRVLCGTVCMHASREQLMKAAARKLCGAIHVLEGCWRFEQGAGYVRRAQGLYLTALGYRQENEDNGSPCAGCGVLFALGALALTYCLRDVHLI